MQKLAREFRDFIQVDSNNDKSKRVIELIKEEPKLIHYIYPNFKVSVFMAICIYTPHLIPYFVKNYGANINQKLNGSQHLPILSVLALASSTNEKAEKACMTLIKLGADINAKTSTGVTALMSSAAANNINILKTLIEYGAKIEDKDDDDGTALMFACNTLSVECAKYLIKSGANVNIKNNNGLTPIMLLFTYSEDVDVDEDEVQNRQTKILIELLKAGADVFAVSNNGKSVLLFSRYSPKCTEILLKYIKGVEDVLKHKQLKLPEQVINKKIMSFLKGFGKSKKKSRKSKRKSRLTKR